MTEERMNDGNGLILFKKHFSYVTYLTLIFHDFEERVVGGGFNGAVG